MAELLCCEYGGFCTGFGLADDGSIFLTRTGEELRGYLKHNEDDKTKHTRENDPGGKRPLL
ncbi:hypothetical protein D3C87_1825000 [compost metagenome]